MIVKICANKNIYDAESCLLAGADIIGFLVGKIHSSDDFIDKDTAKKIVEYVNFRCDTSLVTHLNKADEIIHLTKYIGNTIIQLHSDIAENEVAKIKSELPNIKLVRLIQISNDGKIITDISKFKYVDYYLLDSFNLDEDKIGGTGLVHDWNKSKEIINKLDKPTFLAGGLNASNVKKAILTVKPYGVDVNSGCKVNGIKNRNKVLEFVKIAKGVSENGEDI